MERVDLMTCGDLATLLEWARESLASAAVPCLHSRACIEGMCLRCATESVVARHSPLLYTAHVAEVA